MNKETRVFGYVRFSFLGRSDARMTKTGVLQEELALTTFEKSRIERRFYLFENVCLPCLRAQTNRNFHMVFLTSPLMPDVYKERLSAAIETLPSAEILYSDADHVSQAIEPWMQEHTAALNYPTMHFRLDDDDGISCHMVQRLEDCLALSDKVDVISFPRGLYLTYQEDRPHIVREFVPYIAIALAFINRPGLVRYPYTHVHSLVHHVFRSYMDPGPFSYIHTAHQSSDTISRQLNVFKKRVAGDANYDSERARLRIAKALKREFPGFDYASLEQIITAASMETYLDTKVAE